MKENLEQRLRRGLVEYHGMHNTIAAETGVGQTSISAIARGERHPTIALAEKLIEWLDRADRIVRTHQKNTVAQQAA
jgi:transcriptional regulator with XRE-family HTH domain